MAVPELLMGFGPQHNDHLLEATSVALPTGWSFPAVTDGDSVAPPQTDRWLEIEDTAGSQALGPPRTFAAKTYVWLCIRAFRLSGTLGIGQDQPFVTIPRDPFGTFNFHWVYASASTYNVRVTATGGFDETSGTAYSVDTNLAIRVQWDGTDLKVWINGVLEVDAAEATYPDDARLTLGDPVAATGQEHYWSGIALTHSNSEADRPGTNVDADLLPLSGNMAAEDEYGDDGDCTTDDATYTDAQLDGSDQVDTATYWCGRAAGALKQMAETTTVTPAEELWLGLMWRGACAAFVGSKTADTYARIHDGTNAAEKQNNNITSTDWTGRIHAFPTAPDGGAWTQTDIDNLKCGVRTVGTNDDNDFWAAMAPEFFSIDSDPPGAISANKGFGQVIG